MTRYEIIRMAREADATAFLAPYYIESLERFAALVAKHEQEECAKVCEQHAKDGWDHEGGALACADKIRARGGQ